MGILYNVLKFVSRHDYYPKVLVPAKTSVPRWYKDIPQIKTPLQLLGSDDSAVKMCVPFLEAFTIGYHVLLPADLIVEQINGNPVFKWRNGADTFVEGRSSSYDHPTPPGCNNAHLLWSFPLTIKIPKGHSALLTHPLNHTQLPFFTLSGVIDGEYVMNRGGAIPFFIKEGFEGIIEQGTPIIHVIPFKRQNWKTEIDEKLEKLGEINRKKSNAKFGNWYKNTFWVKKRYV